MTGCCPVHDQKGLEGSMNQVGAPSAGLAVFLKAHSLVVPDRAAAHSQVVVHSLAAAQSKAVVLLLRDHSLALVVAQPMAMAHNQTHYLAEHHSWVVVGRHSLGVELRSPATAETHSPMAVRLRSLPLAGLRSPVVVGLHSLEMVPPHSPVVGAHSSTVVESHSLMVVDHSWALARVRMLVGCRHMPVVASRNWGAVVRHRAAMEAAALLLVVAGCGAGVAG